MANITEKEFDNLARFIVQTAGIQLEKGKEYLMEARLEPLLERYGFETFNDLYQQAISDVTGKLKSSIIDAITINETYFFRDNTPFDLLKNKIIPDIIDQKTASHGHGRIPLKIWSAASSTGQEVYSIGMTLKEMFLDPNRFDISILGTDISNEAIARASYGKYNQFEIERGLGPYHLNKYFTKVNNGWRIKDEIRAMAKFTQADLNQSFSGLGTFDVIFCRNVAIYFPREGKIRLFQKLANALNTGGALLVGGSESLAGLASEFVPRHYLNGVFYQLRLSGDQKAVPPKLSPYQQVKNDPVSDFKPTYPKSENPLNVIPPKPTLTATDQRLANLKKEKEEKKPEIQPLKSEPVPPKNPPEEKPQPVSLSQPESQKKSEPDAEKTSLLDRLRSRSQTDKSSLFNGKKEISEKKASLLEKLKEKDQEKEQS